MGKLIGGILGLDSGKAGQPMQDFKPTGFTSPGLSVKPVDKNLEITTTPLRQELLSGVRGAFTGQAERMRGLLPEWQQEIGGVLGQVQPGMGALTESRLGEIESARRRTVGNLRENLARRRIMGSSFAQDALSRAESEFAKQKADVAAQSKMEELALTNQLMQERRAMTAEMINKAFQADVGSFTTELEDMKFQEGLATQIASGATAAFAANARLQSQINAEAQGTGAELIGGIAGAALPLIPWCWVAEALYGNCWKTSVIRSYVGKHHKDKTLFGQFCRLYKKYGKRWAEIVSTNKVAEWVARKIWDQLFNMALKDMQLEGAN